MNSGKSRKPTHSSSASTTTSSAASSTTKGVQKFYTKIRHKIEDLPPKITAKLHKNSKQPSSGLTSSSPNGKFTSLSNNTKSTKLSKNHQKVVVAKSVQTSPIKDNSRKTITSKEDMVTNSIGKGTPKVDKEDSLYEDIQVISSNPNGSASIVYVDSDEECRLSLNNSKISLEDEIFEELEKVAHDEAKLNEVLKSFDKILTDFSLPIKQPSNQPKSMDCYKSLNLSLPVGCSSSAAEASSQTSSSNIPLPKKLQKSKTCSIIESRCILKKTISDPRNDTGKLSMGLQKPSNFHTTKSLWNLKDFEEFAKSGKKLEKIESCKLPVYTGLNKSLGSATAAIAAHRSSSTTASPKIASGRSKSVWELSGSTLSIAAARSKIPIMKSSSILSLSSRSNSFCEVPQKARSPPSVSKMVKTINDKSPVPAKMFNNVTSSTPKMSITQARRKNLSSAVSTPHSLNRIGGVSPPKVVSIPRSTIKPASSEVSLKKTTTPSSRFQTPLRKQQSSDVLLDKCLEKGHEILRKVEAIGTRSDRKNRSPQANVTVSKAKSPSSSPAGSISKKSSIMPRSYAKIKEQSSAKVLKERNFKTATGKVAANSRKEVKKQPQVSSSPLSQDTIDGIATKAATTMEEEPINQPVLLYAKEESIKFPRLESCKIIPPILGKTSEEHAELLVNVKTKQPTITTPPTTTILIDKLCNNELIQLDKEIYPDSDHDSDDSGHISNENDELLTIASGDCGSSSRSSDSCSKEASPPPSTIQEQHQHQRIVVAASTKISELLEKFEQTNSNSNGSSNSHLHQRQQMHHLHQHSNQASSKKICTAMKIAELEPVKCIQTHIEIFPTYSKEVILRLM